MRSEIILCAGLATLSAGEAHASFQPLTHPNVDQVCFWPNTGAAASTFCLGALGPGLSATGGTLSVSGLLNTLSIAAPLTGTLTNGTLSLATSSVSSITTTGPITGTISANRLTLNSTALDAGTAAATYAPLASPALTGSPTAPTAATANNSTQVATTAFVKAQGYSTGYTLPPSSAGTLGGVFSFSAASHQFLTALSTVGSLSAAQPAFSDLTGSALAAQLPTATAIAAGIVIAPSCSGTSSAFTGISTGTLTCSTLTLPTPAPTASTLGGVFSNTAGANQFATGVSTAGSLTYAQPAFSNISGTATVAQIPLAASGTWTPSVTSVTPGDLALSGVTASGTYDRSILASGCMLHVSWSWTGVVTYTTATGSFEVTGLPYNRANDGQTDWILPGSLSSFAWPGAASMVMWEIGPNRPYMLLRGEKTASSPGVLAITAITSGSTLTISGSGLYKSNGC